MDFRARRWCADGTVKYVGSECDPCHRRLSRDRYSHNREYRERRLRQMHEYWRTRPKTKEERVAEMLRAAKERAATRPIVVSRQKKKADRAKATAREKLNGTWGGDLDTEAIREHVAFYIHHGFVGELPNVVRPARGKLTPEARAREFYLHWTCADQECSHGRLPGDKSDVCGCFASDLEERLFSHRNRVRLASDPAFRAEHAHRLPVSP